MGRLFFQLIMLLVLFSTSFGDDSDPNLERQDVKRLEGIWAGSWGGGESDGRILQPVLAKMVLGDGKIELAGFPGVGQAWGLVRVDAAAKAIKITTAKTELSASKVLEYRYRFTDQTLEITDGQNPSLTLIKRQLERNPSVDIRIELMSADGINEQGDLMVTQFTELKFGRFARTDHESSRLTLKTKGGEVFLVENTEMKKLSIDVARKQLKPATVVGVAFQVQRGPMAVPGIAEEVRLGPPRPEGEAGLKTIAKALRPGTFVFILPSQSLVAEP